MVGILWNLTRNNCRSNVSFIITSIHIEDPGEKPSAHHCCLITLQTRWCRDNVFGRLHSRCPINIILYGHNVGILMEKINLLPT